MALAEVEPGLSEEQSVDEINVAEVRLTPEQLELVEKHAPLALSLASQYRGRVLDYDDVVQEAMVGLINAARRFRPEKGFRFSSFASPTIVGTILRGFRDSQTIVNRTSWEAHTKITTAEDELIAKNYRQPTESEIAEKTGLALKIIRTHELLSHTVSLDRLAEVNPSGTNEPSNPYRANPEDFVLSRSWPDILHAAREKNILSLREHAVIALRYLNEDGPLTQEDVSQRLGVSQMHVSRLEKTALFKLRNYLEQD